MLGFDVKLRLLELAGQICGEGTAPQDIEVMFDKLVSIVTDDWPKLKPTSKENYNTPIDHVNV